jgi:hypothetical protein
MTKRCSKKNFMSSDSSYDAPYTLWDTATVSEMGLTIVVGFVKAHDSKAKPTDRVKAAQGNQSEG